MAAGSGRSADGPKASPGGRGTQLSVLSWSSLLIAVSLASPKTLWVSWLQGYFTSSVLGTLAPNAQQ